MHANLDALHMATYVLIDDFLPPRRGPGRPPKITDAELITLALAQVLMGLPNDRQFLALAAYRLGHLFPYLPKQPGYSKRLRRLTPEIERTINYLAFSHRPAGATACVCSTPPPSPARPRARPPAARSSPASPPTRRPPSDSGATSGAFASTFFAPQTAPRSPSAGRLANASERDVAREMLERVPLEGHTVIADKGFAGREFERWMADRGATFLRPDRKDQEPRFGSLEGCASGIQSVFWTCKGQLGLERHPTRGPGAGVSRPPGAPW